MISVSSLAYLTLLLTSAASSALSLTTVALSQRQTENLASGDLRSAPLTGVDGPDPGDVREGIWDSSWFYSPAIALLLTDPVNFKNLWRDTTESNGEFVLESGSDSAEFTLNKKEGGTGTFKVDWKDVKNDGKADFNKEDPKWWLAGLEYAALQMGGYDGLAGTDITKGHPSDAFYIFSGKPVFNYKNINEKDNLWLQLMKCKTTPTVFQTNDQIITDIEKSKLQPNKWYAMVEAVNEHVKIGQDSWKSGFATYYDAKSGEKVRLEFEELAKDILNVVYVE